MIQPMPSWIALIHQSIFSLDRLLVMKAAFDQQGPGEQGDEGEACGIEGRRGAGCVGDEAGLLGSGGKIHVTRGLAVGPGIVDFREPPA